LQPVSWTFFIRQIRLPSTPNASLFSPQSCDQIYRPSLRENNLKTRFELLALFSQKLGLKIRALGKGWE
jgi:hypothetical protein